MLGLKVMFLRYAPAPHNKRKFKLLIPIGIPTTTSLNNPAKKIKIYPNAVVDFNGLVSFLSVMRFYEVID